MLSHRSSNKFKLKFLETEMRTSTETIIEKEIVITNERWHGIDGNHGLGGTKAQDKSGIIEKDHGIDKTTGVAERAGYMSKPQSIEIEELVRLFNADTRPLTTASLFSVGVKN